MPGHIWSIACLTLKEASRRRVFSVLIVAGTAMASATTFFGVIEMEVKLRLIELWSLRVMTFFSALVAIFFAGFSLPSDMEQKRIYTLVSKPVSKISIYLGKYVGFLLLIGLFLLIMGVITVSYIRAVQVFAGPAFPALKAEPRHFTTSILMEGPGVLRHPEKSLYRLDVVDPSMGPERQRLVWRFRGLKPVDFDEEAKCTIKLEIGEPGNYERYTGYVQVRFIHPLSGKDHRVVPFVQSNVPQVLCFPRELVDGKDGVDVEIRRAEDATWVVLPEQGVILFERGASFEINFFKGLLFLFFQALVALTVTLAASTFVSAPVSILLGIFVILAGSIYGFVDEGRRDVESSLKQAAEARAQKKTVHATDGVPEWVLKGSRLGTVLVLAAIPDFARFEFADYLLFDYAVSWSNLLEAFLYVGWRLMLILLLGAVAISFRDFL